VICFFFQLLLRKSFGNTVSFSFLTFIDRALCKTF
jgi:hypothetical protein